MTDTPIDRISDEYVQQCAALSPLTAIYLGLPSERTLDDLSPDGLAEMAAMSRRQLEAARNAPTDTEAEGVARDVLVERLQLAEDRFEAGDFHASLNVIASPVQDLRMVFDLLPTESVDDYADIARRMAAVPGALVGYRASLLEGAGRGRVSAVRQVDKCADQCESYGSADNGSGFFSRLAGSAECSRAVQDDLDRAAAAAGGAYLDLAAFLRSEIRPHAPEHDAVGAEAYSRGSRDFLGATVDLHETYDWGWEEFMRVEAELVEVAGRIGPGSPREVSEQLDADERYHVRGTDGLQRWMQDLSDHAIEELGRTHFEIPEPLRTLDCKIAPPGGGLGAYYHGPSDDFSRPGSMWWSVDHDRESFTTWREVTTVYHEGVPGHHLQIGTAVHQRESLNDYQRLLSFTSGHGEGWALYAERLVRELGYLDDDGNLLGMLDAQLFRAARVVVDIGMHLELEIPASTGFHEGERWTPQLGLEFMLERTITDPAHVADEIDRYLGWPGQAPSYKVGEKVWLEGRDAARARHGDDFDPKSFHAKALQFGSMGLDPLAALLATI